MRCPIALAACSCSVADCGAGVPTRGDSNQSVDFAEHAGEDTCAT